MLNNRPQGNLPRNTEVYPKEQVQEITLRSGKHIEQSSVQQSVVQNEGLGEKSDTAEKRIPSYVKFMKEILSKKRKLEDYEIVALTEECSAILQMKLPQKRLGMGEARPTTVTLPLADRSVKHPRGIIEDVLVKVDKFIFPADFIVLDMEEDTDVPIILGRPFLAMDKAISKRRVSSDALEAVLKGGEGDDDDADMREYLELKALLDHLSYAYLGEKETLPVIVSADLSKTELEKMLRVLRDHKLAIGWTLADIRGIGPSTVMHKFLLEGDSKPSIEAQRRLNPAMKEVVLEQILKWRMPFRLCNAPTTFQRCMMAIFSDMVGKSIEIFMDDFFVFGSSFDICLGNLENVLNRCENENLVLNWEKCHFMVKEGIVLGHKISRDGIEVDKAKIATIEKLPPPVSVKGVLKEKLISAPIVVAPNWDLPFELMCATSDYVVGAVLGQCIDKVFRSIYYARRTLNDAQLNYATTEKELLAIVFAFDKLRPYLFGNKVIMYTDHSTIKYLMTKKDAKPRLIRWVLLLQEFDIEIHDKKGTEKLVVDHLSRLEIEESQNEKAMQINDFFPDEQLFGVSENPVVPWFADIVNFLVAKVVPPEMTRQQLKKFYSEVKHYYWEEPILYKHYVDQIIRHCVPEDEMHSILATIYNVRTGNISRRNEMPLNVILEVELFDVWGIDFMGPFPPSYNNEYIFLAVDYVSKWVEATATKTNDCKTILNFLYKHIFTCFGTPRALISDEGSHFVNKQLDALLARYGVYHRTALHITPSQMAKLKFQTGR
ncbi:uncharacterized protein LOC133825341 [Humulus lupulus]|uniref:uncharacterized protein LOC133825341 n=1 Tax=Humulus lupulus TaxID=3486 RepID=UPI002B402BC7|nr:uncharacterized protein LOC133825341 [Humulus lupulus]